MLYVHWLVHSSSSKSLAFVVPLKQLPLCLSCVVCVNLSLLQLQDTDSISGDSEVKFQVSKDTLTAMLKSMAYIREQLLLTVMPISSFTCAPYWKSPLIVDLTFALGFVGWGPIWTRKQKAKEMRRGPICLGFLDATPRQSYFVHADAFLSH